MSLGYVPGADRLHDTEDKMHPSQDAGAVLWPVGQECGCPLGWLTVSFLLFRETTECLVKEDVTLRVCLGVEGAWTSLLYHFGPRVWDILSSTGTRLFLVSLHYDKPGSETCPQFSTWGGITLVLCDAFTAPSLQGLSATSLALLCIP